MGCTVYELSPVSPSYVRGEGNEFNRDIENREWKICWFFFLPVIMLQEFGAFAIAPTKKTGNGLGGFFFFVVVSCNFPFSSSLLQRKEKEEGDSIYVHTNRKILLLLPWFSYYLSGEEGNTLGERRRSCLCSVLQTLLANPCNPSLFLPCQLVCTAATMAYLSDNLVTDWGRRRRRACVRRDTRKQVCQKKVIDAIFGHKMLSKIEAIKNHKKNLSGIAKNCKRSWQPCCPYSDRYSKRRKGRRISECSYARETECLISAQKGKEKKRNFSFSLVPWDYSGELHRESEREMNSQSTSTASFLFLTDVEANFYFPNGRAGERKLLYTLCVTNANFYSISPPLSRFSLWDAINLSSWVMGAGHEREHLRKMEKGEKRKKVSSSWNMDKRREAMQWKGFFHCSDNTTSFPPPFSGRFDSNDIYVGRLRRGGRRKWCQSRRT